MADIANVSKSIENTIYNYRTLAKKAVNTIRYYEIDVYDKTVSSKSGELISGAMAALERFFHNLEFLLKYGYLPVSKDTEKGGPLPYGLLELKSFLENTSPNPGDSYVLQCNETERYSFSWQNNGKLSVTEEVFYTSLAGAHCGYACAGGWRARTTTPDVEVNSVLQAFNENSTEKPCQSGLVSDNPHNLAE
ncbi:hypothetical protein F9222_23515 [Escherichia coli]|nr:hypothetical protein F9222_23515 [Escherichia coli]